MAGLLQYAAAGALAGFGEGLATQAKAQFEAVLKKEELAQKQAYDQQNAQLDFQNRSALQDKAGEQALTLETARTKNDLSKVEMTERMRAKQEETSSSRSLSNAKELAKYNASLKETEEKGLTPKQEADLREAAAKLSQDEFTKKIDPVLYEENLARLKGVKLSTPIAPAASPKDSAGIRALIGK